MPTDLYLGSWELIPELCIYEEGQPPLSGRYEIQQSDGQVQISIAWRAKDGADHHTTFGSPNDGTRTPIEAPGVTHLSITRVSASVLDSGAFDHERIVSDARRCTSPDGQLLSTVQIGFRPDGTSFRNFQVYRRR